MLYWSRIVAVGSLISAVMAADSSSVASSSRSCSNSNQSGKEEAVAPENVPTEIEMNGDSASSQGKHDTDVVTQFAKEAKEWLALQAKMDQGKGKRPSWRLHYCVICGLDCARKTDVLVHMQRHHLESHPNFSREEIPPLDDIERYYHRIKNLPNLCRKAKHFVKIVRNPGKPVVVNQETLPQSVKTLKEWIVLKGKIANGKGKRASFRLHFCPICGLDCARKSFVFRHAQIHHKESHPTFSREEIPALDDVERYYQAIKNLKKPDTRVKNFARAVKHELARKNLEVLPQSTKKLNEWISLQAKIEQGKNKHLSQRLHFCPLCGLDCDQKSSVLRHVQINHKESHPTFSREEIPPLDDVESYYQAIKNVKKPDTRVKNFLRAIEYEIAKQNVEVLPQSTKKLKEWISLQAKIENGKRKSASDRLHFCPICGVGGSTKSHVFNHVKTIHNKSHPDFSRQAIPPLDNIERYYHQVKNLKQPNSKVLKFVNSVKQENNKTDKKRSLRTASSFDSSSKKVNQKRSRADLEQQTKKPTVKKRKNNLLVSLLKKKTKENQLTLHKTPNQASKVLKQKPTRNTRKRYLPRQAPEEVCCSLRFKKKRTPLGCESTVEIKLEDIDIKIEPGADREDGDSSSDLVLDAGTKQEEPTIKCEHGPPTGIFPIKIEGVRIKREKHDDDN